MAREDLHFRLRIPEDLKARVEASALENRRSMTAEMVARLEDSFAPSSADIDRLKDRVEFLAEAEKRQQEQLREAVNARGVAESMVHFLADQFMNVVRKADSLSEADRQFIHGIAEAVRASIPRHMRVYPIEEPEIPGAEPRAGLFDLQNPSAEEEQKAMLQNDRTEGRKSE